jgi:hypothetical protein
MTKIQNVDAGKKVDLERVFGFGFITGLLWKRRAILEHGYRVVNYLRTGR